MTKISAKDLEAAVDAAHDEAPLYHLAIGFINWWEEKMVRPIDMAADLGLGENIENQLLKILKKGIEPNGKNPKNEKKDQGNPFDFMS